MARRTPAAAVMAPITPTPRDNFSFFNETDTNSTIIPEVALIDLYSEKVANALNVYYTPVLIVFGALGNILSIIVFFSNKLRSQSTSQYLSMLALSDTIFLLQLVPPWLNAVDVSGLFTKDIMCQLFVYLSYVCCNISAWLVVGFTVERFVAVVHPLRRNAMCTVRRARYIIITLILGGMLINLPVIKFAVPTNQDCNIDYAFMRAAACFNVVDTVVSFTIPLFIIIVLNAWIIAGVVRLGRARNKLLKNNGGESSGGMSRALQWQKSQTRVTRMLLVVSSTFVLLNMPAYTMRIIAYANNMNENAYSGRWAALQQICLLFFNTNFGINFFLYCMSGQNFRRALCQTFRCFRRRRNNGNAIELTTSQRPQRPASVSTSIITNTEGTQCTGMCAVASRSGIVSIERPNHTFAGLRRGRRQRTQRVVRRWRFDNSRQQHGHLAGPSPAAAMSIELRPRPQRDPIDI